MVAGGMMKDFSRIHTSTNFECMSSVLLIWLCFSINDMFVKTVIGYIFPTVVINAFQSVCVDIYEGIVICAKLSSFAGYTRI